MEKTNLVSLKLEDIDQELHKIASPERGGVPPGELAGAAGLFASAKKLFQSLPQAGPVLGFRKFEDWVKARKVTLGVSRSHIYNYTNIGEWLLPRLKDLQDLHKLGTKAIKLAELAKKGKLTDEFLRTSFEMRYVDFIEEADSLLGKESAWTKDVAISDHTTAEAVLLKLGGWQDYDTYTADAGQPFKGKKLGDFGNLAKLDLCGPPEVLKAAKRIDVIWLKGNWPRFFFEVEHTRDITNALHRMFQVVHFDAKFIVVAPPHAHSRFQSEIAKAPFKDHKEKYFFRTYIELRNLFRKASRYHEASKSFFRLDPS